MASAFIKSIRGSDPDAALHYLARMLAAGEDPRFVARRLVISASEDIGLADPQALPIAVAAFQALEFVGLPEARLNLAEAVVYLALAPKSNSAYVALGAAARELEEARPGRVPSHLQSASYAGERKLGIGVGYVYPHDHPGHWAAQRYLPEGLRGGYYQPSDQGREAAMAEAWRRRRGQPPRRRPARPAGGARMSAGATAGGGSGTARRMWQALETLHMTVYFAPEPRDAYRRAGLRGGWMGYFASRSAAMGPVPAEVVMATFYNFHPRMVRRAIPDAWGFAPPERVLAARYEGADAALRRLLGRWVEGAGGRRGGRPGPPGHGGPRPLRPAPVRRPRRPALAGASPTWPCGTPPPSTASSAATATSPACSADGVDGCEAHVLAAGRRPAPGLGPARVPRLVRRGVVGRRRPAAGPRLGRRPTGR